MFPFHLQTCHLCDKDISNLKYISCTNCNVLYCEDCYEKAYWLEIISGEYIPWKIDAYLPIKSKILFGLFQEMYFICSEYCLSNFPAKYEKQPLFFHSQLFPN